MKRKEKGIAMMDYHDMGWSGGWWIVMWVSMALFWTFVVILAARLFATLRGTGGAATDSPEDTLARRLAAGEIDEPTYQRLRNAIRTRHGPLSPTP